MDSQIILGYLQTISHRQPVEDTLPRWQAVRRAQLADGVIDASVAWVVESRRPPALQSPDWIARQRAAIDRSLDVLEPEVDVLASQGEIDLPEMTLGSALEFLDFRLPDYDWRRGRPALAGWLTMFAQRPSMKETAPPR
jgi:glutathione S-transferase